MGRRTLDGVRGVWEAAKLIFAVSIIGLVLVLIAYGAIFDRDRGTSPDVPLAPSTSTRSKEERARFCNEYPEDCVQEPGNNPFGY